LATLITPNVINLISQSLLSGTTQMALETGAISCSGTALTLNIGASYLYQVSLISSLSHNDNSNIVPTTSWVQSAITASAFLAIDSSLTLATSTLTNDNYIFLTGSGAGGGVLTLPVSTNGKKITIRKVGGTGLFTISPDTSNSVLLYDDTVTSGNFVMTADVISSVTLCFTTFTNHVPTLIQAWVVIAVNKV
jgi:hypothetical protein